jgi:hypothetical protein
MALMEPNVRAWHLAPRAESAAMKFHIEIMRTDGADTSVLHRVSAEAIGPRQVKTKAVNLLKVYTQRGATSARVLNDKGEELYRW